MATAPLPVLCMLIAFCIRHTTVSLSLPCFTVTSHSLGSCTVGCSACWSTALPTTSPSNPAKCAAYLSLICFSISSSFSMRSMFSMFWYLAWMRCCASSSTASRSPSSRSSSPSPSSSSSSSSPPSSSSAMSSMKALAPVLFFFFFLCTRSSSSSSSSSC